MADVEEPQFTSLSARIAALNKQGVAKSIGGPQPTGKRPPPPPPPARPPLPSRPQTTNIPPIVSHGSSVTKAPNNLPNDSMGGGGLLPPPVAQDNPKLRITSAKTPPLPARRGPPPLPTRKETSPALPARNGSTQLVRRDSNASMRSFSSTISGLSLGPSASSISSPESLRKLPPSLDQAKLPPLPPSRHEQTLRKAEEQARRTVPMKTVKSSPNVPLRGPPPIDRDQAPKMPPRPTGPPKMPPRPVSRDPSPPQQQRRLPPPNPAPARSALTMGFGQKSGAGAPNPAPRPAAHQTRSAGPAVVELDERGFDSFVMARKPVFIDMYATFCKYCDQLDPIWKELGQNFAFASDRLTIAKLDTGKYKSFMTRFDLEGWPSLLYFDGYSMTPQKCPFMLSLEGLTQWLEEKSGIYAADAPEMSQASGVPPPINLKSKPTRNDIKAIQNRPAPAEPPTSGCLLCRDFSGPDGVAAQYPRHSLPRNQDSVSYLAGVLCGPFRYHTDKARAIFTWLHHNIAYDTVAFFGNNVKHMEPRDNISSGLAVCGGYAGVFAAIALKAGLEAVMVTGHGKGYGHTPLGPHDRLPPCKVDGHAWNAVRIDGGEWKLIDPCWGAGNVNNQVFNKVFTASYFTMSNDEFGLKHFPQDKRYFYRSDGTTPTWEWYMRGPSGTEPLQLFNSVEEHGISPTSFSPAEKLISISSNETVRFQFSKMCEHWDHEKNGSGKPYPFILKIGGKDGRNEDFVAFENNEHWWWCDIPARDLGAVGQTLHCYAVTTIDGRDARGVSRREYLSKKGKVGMGFGGVACWTLGR